MVLQLGEKAVQSCVPTFVCIRPVCVFNVMPRHFMFVETKQNIFDEATGHFQPCLWVQSGVVFTCPGALGAINQLCVCVKGKPENENP